MLKRNYDESFDKEMSMVQDRISGLILTGSKIGGLTINEIGWAFGLITEGYKIGLQQGASLTEEPYDLHKEQKAYMANLREKFIQYVLSSPIQLRKKEFE